MWIFLILKFKMGKSAKKRHEKNDSKYKRLGISGISRKLEIIEKLESKETTRVKIAQQYGISETTVHRIMKEKENTKV